VEELTWLTAPPPAALARARVLLQQLEALNPAGQVTDHGRQLVTLGTHPRLAHMLLGATGPEAMALACDLAALIEERDVLQGDGPAHDADLRLRAGLLRAARRGDRLPDRAGEMRVRRDALHAVAEAARGWRRQLGLRRDADWTDDEGTGRLVALAFPDRVAQRRGEVDAGFGAQITVTEDVAWDGTARAVRGTRREVLGALVLRETVEHRPDPALVSPVLRDRLMETALGDLTWGESAQAVRHRLAFLHHHLPEWPDVSDGALLAEIDHWLVPHLDGVRSVVQLAALDLGALLLNQLDWTRRNRLDVLAPTHYVAPTGSRLPIDYADPAAPVLRVRLQEMFGLADGPRVLDGRVGVTLHLLSPAHRPLQVTRDLAGFWRSSYRDVQKEMRGRYPRHYWPDNPLEAEPTRRAKPRGS
jgi:ATP-dependent helicase HrpB